MSKHDFPPALTPVRQHCSHGNSPEKQSVSLAQTFVGLAVPPPRGGSTNVTHCVGPIVGYAVDGVELGTNEGRAVGANVGESVGTTVGHIVGASVGKVVGLNVGAGVVVGVMVGEGVGLNDSVGERVQNGWFGKSVQILGNWLVGTGVGASVGGTDGTGVGVNVGFSVGIGVGVEEGEGVVGLGVGTNVG